MLAWHVFRGAFWWLQRRAPLTPPLARIPPRQPHASSPSRVHLVRTATPSTVFDLCLARTREKTRPPSIAFLPSKQNSPPPSCRPPSRPSPPSPMSPRPSFRARPPRATSSCFILGAEGRTGNAGTEARTTKSCPRRWRASEIRAWCKLLVAQVGGGREGRRKGGRMRESPCFLSSHSASLSVASLSIIHFACTGHTVVLTDDKEVWSWGRGDDGRLVRKGGRKGGREEGREGYMHCKRYYGQCLQSHFPSCPIHSIPPSHPPSLPSGPRGQPLEVRPTPNCGAEREEHQADHLRVLPHGTKIHRKEERRSGRGRR